MKNLIFKFLCVFGMALLLACGGQSEPKQGSPGDSLNTDTSTVQADVFVFDTNSIDQNVKPDKNATPYKGTLISAVGWTDKAGENVLIFSRKEAYIINKDEELRKAEFYACCYIKQGETCNLQWEITDNVDKCYCDCDVALVPESIRIVDLDKDGIAENLFLYLLNDRCDASPVRTKLMMHSGKNKMAIRGYSQQYLGPSEAETNRFRKEQGLEAVKFKEIDAAFDQFSPEFKKYASDFWDGYIKKENQEFNK
jgi:hypothetical protein